MSWEDTPFDFGDSYDLDRSIHQDHAETYPDNDPAELTHDEHAQEDTMPATRKRPARDWQGDLAELGEEIRQAAETETRAGLAGEFARMAKSPRPDDLGVIRHYFAQAAMAQGIDPRYFTGGVPLNEWTPTPEICMGLALAGVLASSDEFEW